MHWLILVVIATGVAAMIAFGIFDVGKIKESLPGQSTKIIEDRELENLQKLGTSDEVVDIEKDLSSTNLENLDQELSDIDQASSEL